jgi:hypothetical protein
MGLICFSGITDAAIMPLLALLVDTRHVALYGSVYAIAQLAVCLVCICINDRTVLTYSEKVSLSLAILWHNLRQKP